MASKCPYCAASVALPDLKPGRYTPACPKCGRKLLLIVVEGSTPTISALPEPSPDAAPRTSLTEATSPTLPESPRRANSSGSAHDPEETRIQSPEATGLAAPVAEPAGFTLGGSFVGEKAGPEKTGARKADATQANRPGTDDVAAGVAPSSLLGGYRILKMLGEGGMGAVFLGRQVSLDRLVAVKVMKPEWASDPRFVARFTREAFAAAQLVHHNVVQIYDIGCEKDVHYFSMEFVDGRSLAELVKAEGKLDAETAARYILQAAHGLKFAHEQGMVHRDVKPDNILLNKHGVVKVVDLGLVKTPAAIDEASGSRERAALGPETKARGLGSIASESHTLANASMGTPAYMAPEQAENAAQVDQRADVYSLGCTLFALITGRPLFEGHSAVEVIAKHKHEPVTPPDVIDKRTPKSVSDVIVKMVAKRPEDRYQSMDEVLKALGKVVGVETGGTFTPSDAQVESLQRIAREFREAPAARLRAPLAWGFFGGAALLAVLCFMLSFYGFFAAFAGVAVLTPIAYFITVGLLQRTYLFVKVREFVLSSDLTDWAMGVVGATLVLAVLYFLGMLTVWFAIALLAAALAYGAYRAVDQPLATQRAPAIAAAEELLRSLRTQGVEEDAVRAFFAKQAGDDWEEFFEALFGYEAKLAARAKYGRNERNEPRPRFAAWRDPFADWVEVRQRARNEARAERVLQRVEERNLQAQGVAPAEARDRAEETAKEMVREAASLAKDDPAARDGAAAATADDLAKARRAKMRKLMEAAERNERQENRVRRTGFERLLGLLGMLIGPRIRFIVGALLLIGAGAWLSQNDLIPTQQVAMLTETVGTDQSLSPAAEQQARALADDWRSKYVSSKPLHSAAIPSAITNLFFDVNSLAAGLLLVISALFRGLKIDWSYTLGAAVAFIGPFVGVPDFGIGAGLASAAIGLGIAIVGWLFTPSE
ncbi:MAG TPA: protein kinase [Pirellulales bacterium]